MTTTIAISNHKGGVAKTTTAVNLAAGLAKKGRNVLLIDLDPQGDATYGLGIALDDDTVPTMAEVLGEERLPIQNVIMDTIEPKLKLAPADIRLAKPEMQLVSTAFRELVLKKALQTVSGFDFVIIDCPPSLSVLTINGLVCAEHILIPATPSGHALKGLGYLLETIAFIKSGEPYEYRILLTNISGHGEERNVATQRILSPLKNQILKTRIGRTEAIELSQMEGEEEEPPMPVVLSKDWNVGARDYRSLVKEIGEIWGVQKYDRIAKAI